jgi:ubiquinone/menaquinone biosynthesis C-methylase UbiE
MSMFDALAERYDASRIGYSNDVYNNLVSFGLKQGHRILDIGCGTGIASAPLIENGFDVTGVDPSAAMIERAKSNYPRSKWGIGSAEKLAVPDNAVDAAISAQAFHLMNRDAAIAEIVRVLKPGRMVSIWWKHLSSDDVVKLARDDAARSVGFEPPLSGLKGGFKEFYASALRDQAVRVIPWRTTATLSRYMDYERSRPALVEAAGAKAEAYFAELEERLRGRFGEGDPLVQLAYTHFQYLARK